MSDIYISSVDSLIKLFNAKVDLSLPDAKEYEKQIFTRALPAKHSARFYNTDDLTDACAQISSKELFSRRFIRFENRDIWVWDKIE